MIDPINRGYVNWVDGMKLSKEHFMDMQHAVEARLRDQYALATYLHGSGILPARENGRSSLDYRLSIEPPAKVTFTLTQCRGITSAGDRVEILASDGALQPLSATFDLSGTALEENARFDVILRVEPYTVEPYGPHDPGESPPRHPFSRPRWTLDLAPLKDMRYTTHGHAFLVLARVMVKNGALVKDGEYLPPAMAMSSLPALEEFLTSYFKFLKEVEQNLLAIVARLNERKTPSDLTDGIGVLCKAGLYFLEREISAFQVLGFRMPPDAMVMHAISFARAMHYALELRTNKGEEALLASVKEATGLARLEYRQVLNGLMDLVYDPNDLDGALKRILQFCQVHRKLFGHWAQLKNFGATGPERIILNVEQPPTPQPSSRSWNF